jgi:drug/metabolite transporter (DMT)-like permease
MVALALALVSSVAWGFADFFAGLCSRRLPVAKVVMLVVAGGAVSSLIVGFIAGAEWPGSPIVLPGVLGGLASLVAFTSFYRALAIGPMSIVAPIGGMYPIVPVAVGLALGERPSAVQIAGMAFVLAGVVAATYTSPGATTQRVTRAAVLLAVTAALASGAALIGISRAAVEDPYWGIVLVRSTAAVGVAAYLATRYARARRLSSADLEQTGFGGPAGGPAHSGDGSAGSPASRSAPGSAGSAARPSPFGLHDVPALVGIGALDTFATGLFGYAATFGYLSLVAVISSLFPLITVGLAKLVLGERVQPHQNAGVIVALAGAAMIAVG